MDSTKGFTIGHAETEEIDCKKEREVGAGNMKRLIKDVNLVLSQLEDSILKSCTYEKLIVRNWSHEKKMVVRCNDGNEDKDCRQTLERLSHTISRNDEGHDSPTGSWSTMSVVCMQIQYEELHNKYESLLRAYTERSNALIQCNLALVKATARADRATRLAQQAHRVVIQTGNKYLALKEKKDLEKRVHDQSVEAMNESIASLCRLVERYHANLEEILTIKLAAEPEVAKTLLLLEIKRSNDLFVENLKLKRRLYDFDPSSVSWNYW